MKLLESLIEKTLNKSPLLFKAAEAIESVAKEVHNLGIATMALAHTVQAHHNAIVELHARQAILMKALKSNSLDMQMPDGKDKEKASKPN